jgi:LysR family transcriptional regulator, glycine cleavage system transcriptional activator
MIQNLSALFTFVTVAKHLSFTKAAHDLFITQGAVSIQIKQLEAELGFQLFHREARKIFLTSEGEEVLETVEPALRQIQTRIETVKTKSLDGPLVVSTLPSFASKWLIPRVLQFQEKYPDIGLRIHTSFYPVDFVYEKIDCAIRLGKGIYKGLFVDHLVDEYYFPVCSPDLINLDSPLIKPEDIQNYQILHDYHAEEDYNITWKQWAVNMGVAHLDTDRGLQYGQSDYVIQAAIARQGIALSRASLANDDIKSGLLVSLFNNPLKSNYSYCFVCPPEYSTMRKVIVFRDWIKKTIQNELGYYKNSEN